MRLTKYLTFTGRVDRWNSTDSGNASDVFRRENLLSRGGVLNTVKGLEKVISSVLTSIPRWTGRYYTIETGLISPKTFVYTEDGKLSVLNERDKTHRIIKEGLNTNAYPRHAFFKTSNQTKMYLVDGRDLWKHDGNNDNRWEKVPLTDTNQDTINPIFIIEHRDRLWLLSETDIYVSKNLDPEVFDDATDSLNLIVGSGRSKNRGFGLIEDNLYIFTTEGIFAVIGDLISAVASTFDIRLVDNKKCISSGSIAQVNKAINFLADDREIWSWDGQQVKLLSHLERTALDINDKPDMLAKIVSTYNDGYYKLSVVEKGKVENNLEFWWDAFENKIDFIKGRNVTCYASADPSEEEPFDIVGRTDKFIDYENRGRHFDGTPIPIQFRSKDIPIHNLGVNARIVNFYPKLKPHGNMNLVIRYHLDSRLSFPVDGTSTTWSQNLRGETRTLGSIEITRQSQFTGRNQPLADYARGETIAFEIVDSQLNMEIHLKSIGVEYIPKKAKKAVTIGA